MRRKVTAATGGAGLAAFIPIGLQLAGALNVTAEVASTVRPPSGAARARCWRLSHAGASGSREALRSSSALSGRWFVCYRIRGGRRPPLFGAFLAGLGTRRWLQQHITLLFRLHFAGGIGLLSVLAG